MKRSGPIKRKTRLKADPDAQRAWERRSRENARAKARTRGASNGARRRTPMQRGKKINTVNAKRREAERARAYGPRARRDWLTSQPCLVCGTTPTEQAHTVSGGMGRKADADTIVPLCHAHHAEQHAHGAATFEARYSVDLAAAAADTERRWLAHSTR